jgi:hypothetical protein
VICCRLGLHFGRGRRWFTSAQIRALWLRDRHCTFPGCRAPATWCEAHHVWHWLDGGPTDLTNGTLLCGRQHKIVHRDRLTAIITTSATGNGASSDNPGTEAGTGGVHVLWDRTPGSYDRALARALDGPPR